jgi:hypothetical protein
MSDKKDFLTENWGEAKEVLLDGLSHNQRKIVSPLLENQRNYMLKETAASGSIQAHDVANFRQALLPVVRRVIPGSMATEIVGVQPMSGPVGLVYSMRYTYNEDVTHDPSKSPFGGFDIVDGDEAFGNSKLLRAFYSGNTGSAQDAGASGMDAAGADGTSAPADIDAATADGDAWESSAGGDYATGGTDGTMDLNNSVNVAGTLLGGSGSFIEGSGGRKMGLELLSQAVQAGSRKLQAGWTLEAMQDLDSQHGLDIESEMTRGMSAHITQEIDAEVLSDLLALAGTVRTYDHAATLGPNYAPAFVGDRFANLQGTINEVANEIGRKIRVGVANWIVVSPMIVSALQTASKAVFAPAVEGSFEGPNDTKLVGTLNGSVKVYSYLWNAEQPGASSPAGDAQILVGYKGGNGESQAGYFYAPYIPLMSTGVVMNPVTTQPMVSLMTRYGKVALTDPTISLGNSADYYGKINVSNLQFL